jgi:hypothetical protein
VNVAARIVIESPAPPEAVLAAILEDAREWRESVVPPALRKEYRVTARVEGDRFRLQLPKHLDTAEPVTLRGVVSPAPQGGSLIRASFHSGGAKTALLLGAVGIVLLIWSLPAGSLLLAWAAVDAAVQTWRASRLGPESSATTLYLADRLNAAVTAAQATGRRTVKPGSRR